MKCRFTVKVLSKIRQEDCVRGNYYLRFSVGGLGDWEESLYGLVRPRRLLRCGGFCLGLYLPFELLYLLPEVIKLLAEFDVLIHYG